MSRAGTGRNKDPLASPKDDHASAEVDLEDAVENHADVTLLTPMRLDELGRELDEANLPAASGMTLEARTGQWRLPFEHLEIDFECLHKRSQAGNLCAYRARALAASSSRFFGGASVSSASNKFLDAAATASTAARNAASLAFDGLLKPLTFLTNCNDAARISASVTGGSKLNSGLMFLHIGVTPIFRLLLSDATTLRRELCWIVEKLLLRDALGFPALISELFDASEAAVFPFELKDPADHHAIAIDED